MKFFQYFPVFTKSALLIVALQFANTPLFGTLGVSYSNLVFGFPIPTSEKQFHSNNALVRIDRAHYTLLHDNRFKTSLFVSYHLSKEDLMGIVSREDRFASDPLLPIGHRGELADYLKSGFDRGHLAPAADMKISKEAMRESFYLANIAPQSISLNRGIWKRLEEQLRVFYTFLYNIETNHLNRERRVNGWVITGSVFSDLDGDGVGDALGTIGAGRVGVPTHFYKIAVVTIENEIHMFPFLFQHDNFKFPTNFTPHPRNVKEVHTTLTSPKRALSGYLTNVDAIEALLQLDLFWELPDDVESALEKKVPVDATIFDGTISEQVIGHYFTKHSKVFSK